MRCNAAVAALAALVTGCLTGPGPTWARLADAAPAARAAATVAGESGAYEYRFQAPAGRVKGARPLVVMLHGCGQDPASFAHATRMDEVAQRHDFAVLYPAQRAGAHPRRCWRWYDPANQRRGSGEPGALAQMAVEVASRHGLDRQAIYVAGLSAGAAMAAILAATYPDVFAAAGAASGLEYGAATSVADAWVAMSLGGPDPRRLAAEMVAGMGPRRRAVPMVVFHGDADFVVKPINADQLATQWASVGDRVLGERGGRVDTEPSETLEERVPGGHMYVRSRFKDHTGRTHVEKVVVRAMGHAWSGGLAGGSFADPRGPDASARFWEFFAATRNLAPASQLEIRAARPHLGGPSDRPGPMTNSRFNRLLHTH